jgi:hypothetical protein
MTNENRIELLLEQILTELKIMNEPTVNAPQQIKSAEDFFKSLDKHIKSN